VPDGIFIQEAEDRFLPTELARGPWDRDAQHGGAPAALIARAFEHMRDDAGADPLAVVRLSYEFLRPVPLTPLTLTTAVARPGRRVQLLEASLRAGELEVCRASALRIRRADVAVPAPEPVPAPPRGPQESPAARTDVFDVAPMFARDGMEVRLARGDFGTIGPAFGWFRLRVPLVAGEETSPLQRLAAAGDFGNGISIAVDWRTHLFINPDLTIYVERLPEGEWVGLDAVTRLGTDGTGISDSVLHDARGRVGRAQQALYVAERD
jgi:acyl-coenzyme A thioesterase PaaI-like protein